MFSSKQRRCSGLMFDISKHSPPSGKAAPNEAQVQFWPNETTVVKKLPAPSPQSPSLLNAPLQTALRDLTRNSPDSHNITPDRCCSKRCERASRPLSRPSPRTCSLCACGAPSSARRRCGSCSECEESECRKTVQTAEDTKTHEHTTLAYTDKFKELKLYSFS